MSHPTLLSMSVVFIVLCLLGIRVDYTSSKFRKFVWVDVACLIISIFILLYSVNVFGGL